MAPSDGPGMTTWELRWFPLSQTVILSQKPSQSSCAHNIGHKKQLVQHGTGCNTNNTCITLYWKQWLRQWTVPLDPSINIGILYVTTGYVSSDTQCAAIEDSIMTEYGTFCCHDLGIVLDEDNSSTKSVGEDEEELSPPQPERAEAPSTTTEAKGAPHVIEFDLQGPEDGDLAPINIDEEEQVSQPASATML